MIGRRATHHRTVRRGPILDRPIPIDTHRLQVQSERRLERGVFTTLLDIRDHFNSFAPPASRILGTLPDRARADTRKPFTFHCSTPFRGRDRSRERSERGGSAVHFSPSRAPQSGLSPSRSGQTCPAWELLWSRARAARMWTHHYRAQMEATWPSHDTWVVTSRDALLLLRLADHQLRRCIARKLQLGQGIKT